MDLKTPHLLTLEHGTAHLLPRDLTQFLPSLEIQTTTTVQASLPTIPTVETQDTTDTTGVGKQLSGMMGDAPPCGTCGHITIRNGAINV